MYTYPEALDAMERLAKDYFLKAAPNSQTTVRVVADAKTGTASVDWTGVPGKDYRPIVEINMPVRPATSRMSAGEFDHWAAYMLHEVGHPLHTDKAVWTKAVAANQHNLLNALEDVREEKATIDMGLAFNARDAFAALVDMHGAKAAASKFNPNHYRNIGWTMSSLGRHANGYAMDVSYIVDNLDPNGRVAKVLKWAMPALAACRSTEDCYKLTLKVAKALAPAKGEKVPPLRTGEPGGEGEGQGKPGQGQGQGQGKGRSKASNEPAEAAGEPADEPGEGEGQEGAGRGAGASAGSPEALSDRDIKGVDLTPSDRDNIKPASDYHEAEARRVTALLVEQLRKAAANKLRSTPIRGDAGYLATADRVTAKAGQMGRQRQLLAKALKKNESDHYEGNRTHGRFNTRALTKAVNGNPHVFGKRHIEEGYDTDVQILVDGSGSMSGVNIVAASILALVVAQAAAQVGIECHAHLFNDRGLHEAHAGRRKPVGKKFGAMPGNIMGGTPLTQNMIEVATAQAKRAPNKRKVLFLVTDGGCNQGHAILKAAGQYVEEALGIEIADLHIGDRALGAFRNEVACPVNKVERVGLDAFTRTLERGL